MNKTLLFIISIFIFIYQTGFSQNKILQKRISIKIEKKTAEDALEIISKQGNFFFSYNSDIIKPDSIVSIYKQNETIENIISQLFSEKIYALESGNYLILKKKSNSKKIASNENKKVKYHISGTVYNSITGEKIENAGIYQIGKTNSTLSNIHGNYNLYLNTKSYETALAFSAKNYIDTIIIIKPSDTSISVKLMPVEHESFADNRRKNLFEPADNPPEIKKIPIVRYAVPKKQFDIVENLKFTEKQYFQISVLPNVGTNNLMSGNVQNNFSLNILGGYSHAVKGFEAGSLINVVRNGVTGVQVCGIANITGAQIKGAQIAGVFNKNKGNTSGVQAAGVFNSVSDSINGLQIAGFANLIKGKIDGGQIAGFTNIAKNDAALQISGFANIAGNNADIAQISGFANLTRNNVGGLQLAGFANIAKNNVSGVQFASFFNIARNVKSAQISACINIAEKVDGTQLGIINIADTVNGVAVGFFSFVKSGTHNLEFSFDETGFTNIQFKTGTTRFYNILGSGILFPAKNKNISLTYGTGKQYNIGKKFYFLNELTGTHFFTFPDIAQNINSMLRLNLDFGFKFLKHSGISLGISANFLASDFTDDGGNYTGSQIAPNFAKHKNFTNFYAQYWPGARISVRL